MKWLIILLLILVVIALVAYRYRNQLRTAWFMYQAFRKMRQKMQPAEKQVETRTRTGDSELVRCPKCNKWVAMEEAVKLKSNYYCSLNCLEESVTIKRPA